MKTNAYELQSEIFNRVINGEDRKSLWSDLRDRKQDLRHLCEGGNPSDTEYREQLSQVASRIREEVQAAEDLGPFAHKTLRLRFEAIDLAGKVCKAIMAVEPDTITDAEDIDQAYRNLAANVNADNLRDCDVVLGDRFAEDINRIYGAKAGKVADAASSLTQ